MNTRGTLIAATLSLTLLAAAGLGSTATAAPRASVKDAAAKTYIVKTKSVSAASGVASAAEAAGGEIKNVYQRVYPGFSAKLTAAQVAGGEGEPEGRVGDRRPGGARHHDPDRPDLGSGSDRPTTHDRRQQVQLRHDWCRRHRLRRRHRDPADPQSVRRTGGQRLRLRRQRRRRLRLQRPRHPCIRHGRRLDLRCRQSRHPGRGPSPGLRRIWQLRRRDRRNRLGHGEPLGALRAQHEPGRWRLSASG